MDLECVGEREASLELSVGEKTILCVPDSLFTVGEEGWAVALAGAVLLTVPTVDVAPWTWEVGGRATA